tara:strand:- start:961 stop:1221 length:261 start_codon:yes stop_codon:yes gene_type:complete
MLSMTNGIIIIVIIVIIGLIYMMKDTIKDTLFPPKQVTFNPTVKQINEDDYVPSETFTGRKPGYIFTRGEQGLGYYRDEVEIQKFK